MLVFCISTKESLLFFMFDICFWKEFLYRIHYFLFWWINDRIGYNLSFCWKHFFQTRDMPYYLQNWIYVAIKDIRRIWKKYLRKIWIKYIFLALWRLFQSSNWINIMNSLIWPNCILLIFCFTSLYIILSFIHNQLFISILKFFLFLPIFIHYIFSSFSLWS